MNTGAHSKQVESKISVELQRLVLQASADNAWARRLEDKVRKVVIATKIDSHTDTWGTQHRDYFVGEQLIFSDSSSDGKRVRTSFNIVGRQEGKLTDFADGRSSCTFNDGDNYYSVKKDRFGTSVSRGDVFGNWIPVSKEETRREILLLVSIIFTPPQTLLRVA